MVFFFTSCYCPKILHQLFSLSYCKINYICLIVTLENNTSQLSRVVIFDNDCEYFHDFISPQDFVLHAVNDLGNLKMLLVSLRLNFKSLNGDGYSHIGRFHRFIFAQCNFTNTFFNHPPSIGFTHLGLPNQFENIRNFSQD